MIWAPHMILFLVFGVVWNRAMEGPHTCPQPPPHPPHPPPRDVTWAKLTVILRRLGRPDTGCFEQKHKRTTYHPVRPRDALEISLIFSQRHLSSPWQPFSALTKNTLASSLLDLTVSLWYDSIATTIWLVRLHSSVTPDYETLSPTDPKPLKRE